MFLKMLCAFVLGCLVGAALKNWKVAYLLGAMIALLPNIFIWDDMGVRE